MIRKRITNIQIFTIKFCRGTPFLIPYVQIILLWNKNYLTSSHNNSQWPSTTYFNIIFLCFCMNYGMSQKQQNEENVYSWVKNKVASPSPDVILGCQTPCPWPPPCLWPPRHSSLLPLPTCTYLPPPLAVLILLLQTVDVIPKISTNSQNSRTSPTFIF